MFRDKFITISDWLLNLLPYVSIVVAVAGALYLFISGNLALLFKAIFILGAVVVVSLLLIIKKKTIQNTIRLDTAHPIFLNIPEKILQKIFVIVFVATIIVSLLTQAFTTPFLLLIVVLYGIIIVQIFSKHGKSWPILVELLLVTGLFMLVKFSSYEFTYTICDTIYHVNFIDLIKNAGYVPEGSGSYQLYSGYHILAVSLSLLTTLSTYCSAFIPHIVYSIIIGIFVYYVALDLTKSKIIAELSILFYLLMPRIMYAMSAVYPSMDAGLTFFLILYLFFRKNEAISMIPRILLSTTLTLYFITVHHASSFALLLIFTLILLSYWLYKKHLTSSQKTVVFVFYGIVIAKLIISYIASVVSQIYGYILMPFSKGDLSGQEIVTLSSNNFDLTFVFNSAICCFMILFVYLFIYHLISKNNSWHAGNLKIILPIVILFFLFMLPHVGEYLPIIGTAGVAVRYGNYLAPIFGIVLATGCFLLLLILMQKKERKKMPFVICIVLCIMVVITGPLVGSGAGSYSILGESIYSPSHDYFTAGEISSFETAKDIIPNKSHIATDYHGMRYLTEWHNWEAFGIPDFDADKSVISSMLSEKNSDVSSPYVLIRDYQYQNDGLYLWVNNVDTKTHSFSETEYVNFQCNVQNYNKIYDDCASKIYQTGS